MKSFILFLKQSDKFFLYPLFLSTLSAVVLILLFIIFQNSLPIKLPLFYSFPWGEQQLADKNNYLLLPALLIITTAINTLIAWQIHPTQIVLRRITLLSTISINIILLITGVKILSVFVL